jgi:CBS domain-containing protein
MSLIPGTIAHLRRHAPFDRMDARELEPLAAQLTLAYFPALATILGPAGGVPGHLYIIKQGAVSTGAGIVLHDGECFPLGALVARRPVSGEYRAARDTFCFLLPAPHFHEWLERSPVFHAFCTQRIANMLGHAAAAAQGRLPSEPEPPQPLDRRLAEVVQRAPVTCDAATPIRSALETMEREGIGSMLVTDAQGALAGIFTLKDLLARVSLPGVALEQPIAAVMTARPVTLPREAFAYEAALAMAEHHIHHVVVTENAGIAGLVSERDLFALQRVGLRQVGAAIERATRIEALAQLAGSIREMTQQFIAQGADVGNVIRIVASLHDRLSRRVIELEAASAPPDAFCWISLGSEGRRERTLASDQDNAIVFAASATEAPAVRERLLPVAARINRSLAAVGFPECRGFIMASNPKWCLSEAEWRMAFAGWIAGGDPQAILHSNIFFDFSPLHGDVEPARALREWLAHEVAGNARFLRLMAENALANRPPLGLLRDFETGDDPAHPGTIDLKMRGATPFTDAARVYALAHGVTVTNTAERLLEAARRGAMPASDAQGHVAAFHFLQHFRLRHQHALMARGEEPDNHLDPDRLNDIDRRLLRECLRSAQRLQQRLALDYRL